MDFWTDPEKGGALEAYLFDETTVYGKEVLPPRGHRLSALKLCPFERTRVVILGESPSPTPGYSNGLAYGVLPGAVPAGATRNIFKELERSEIPRPPDYTFHGWAKQGVLMLPCDLTTVKDQPGAHDGLWIDLIEEIIETLVLLKHGVPLVFMLWGEKPKEVFELCAPEDSVWNTEALVLEAPSPRPLTANRFIGHGHFAECNRYFQENAVPLINWSY